MRLLSLLSIVLSFTACGNDQSSTSETKEVLVGSTRDACDRNEMVRVHARDGIVELPANSDKTFSMGAPNREVFWNCGGSRERSANDHAFVTVHAVRHDNGAIDWYFLR